MPFDVLPNEIQQKIILDIPREIRAALSQANLRAKVPNSNFIKADRIILRQQNERDQELPYHLDDTHTALEDIAFVNAHDPERKRTWTRIEPLPRDPQLLSGRRASRLNVF